MAAPDVHNQYYTLESRLASFHQVQLKPKRRTSVASKKNQKTAGAWPHYFLSPQSLAEAGFYYAPKTDGDDNVTCFLCTKSLAGWEEGDDALSEHLQHSRECGWAILTAIEGGDEEFKNEDPTSDRMKQARKDTFGDFWPHDGKKGWTAKSRQMADSGWKYTPSLESDDLAQCVYCDLTLDAWEPQDKPLLEHQKRSPDCAFFKLATEFKQNKKTKSKSARTSKISRLSTQSNITSLSEAQSHADEPVEEDDSMMTTATNATVQSRTGTKMAKGKKATAAKGRKTRVNKHEPEEVIASEPEDDIPEVQVEAPKITRGKKRTSEEMDDDPSSIVEQPTKRRVTRTRGSLAMHQSIISVTEQVTEDPPAEVSEQPRKRGRPSRASRKISIASVAIESEQIPDDEAIDQALEADLERQLTDDEAKSIGLENDAPKIRRVTREVQPAAEARTRRTRASVISHFNSSMFDSQPVEVDDSSIEKELAVIEVEESKPLPKAKATKIKAVRKPSVKQLAAARRAAEAARVAEEAAQAEAEADAMALDVENENELHITEPSPKARKPVSRQPRQVQARSTRTSAVSVDEASASYTPSDLLAETQGNDSGHDSDASMASQSTVIRGGKTRRGSSLKTSKGGKKAASRHIEDIIHKDAQAAPLTKQVAKSKKGKEKQNLEEDEGLAIFEDAIESELEHVASPAKAKSKKSKGKGKVLQELPIELSAATPDSLFIPFSPKLVSSTRKSPQPPSTPGGPREANASPSPQSSDAENHPPSSRPSTVRNSLNLQDTTMKHTTRIPLASTPTGSISKRNIINGLQTSQPWTALDLDTIFAKSPTKDDDTENRDPARSAFNDILDRARTGNITSPEKKMTVEEWIVHNARVAEEKLRNDCERMVGVFEEAGQRAMRSVEGIKCLDDERVDVF